VLVCLEEWGLAEGQKKAEEEVAEPRAKRLRNGGIQER